MVLENVLCEHCIYIDLKEHGFSTIVGERKKIEWLTTTSSIKDQTARR